MGRPPPGGCGAGKLCQALSITRGCYGLDLCGDTLYLLDDGFRPASVAQSRRIGIDYAGRPGLPWRFYLPGNPHVSGGRDSAHISESREHHGI